MKQPEKVISDHDAIYWLFDSLSQVEEYFDNRSKDYDITNVEIYMNYGVWEKSADDGKIVVYYNETRKKL